MNDKIKRFLRNNFDNWQTTVIGAVIIVFTTWVFLEGKISWEQAVMGWNTGFGFLIAKDALNQNQN